MDEKKGFFQKAGTCIGVGFGKIGAWFRAFGEAVAKGDIFVKLSLLIMGAEHFRRKQIIKGIIMTLFEVVIVAYTALVGIPYISKFGTLASLITSFITSTIFSLSSAITTFNEFIFSPHLVQYY